MVAVAETLFQDFKNKSDIMTAIQDLQLSGNTRRIEAMSDDVCHQMKRDVHQCEFFSLQFDESTDVVDTAHLNIFIRMIFKDTSIKEDLFAVLPLKGKTRGEDIYQAFKDYIQQLNVPLHKLVSITTDGAPAMVGSKLGFISLCRNDPAFPPFLNYHCVIHQESLCSKVIDFHHVMKVVVKIVNSIRARPLQHRLFKAFLDEFDAQYKDLPFYTEVRWLSRGKLLQRFQDLLPEISQFLEEKDELYSELYDSQWLADLAFLTDMTSKLNNLNLELQGQDKTITQMIGTINAFKEKLKMWLCHLKRNVFHHFSSLQKRQEELLTFKIDAYIGTCEKLIRDFDKRFADFQIIEPVVTFLSNPFMDTDVCYTAEQIANIFKVSVLEVENEIITLRTDVQLKSRSLQNDFWKLVEICKFPILKGTSQRLNSCFGSTYLCESGFSAMKILKSKYRTRLNDDHLGECMRVAITNYTPDFQKLAENMQCQISH
uniref:DUF4371 domain-containing protein n=1 Tax=Xenopus tropicalis TaxID=8364 RepID=A0A803JGL7_XENTR